PDRGDARIGAMRFLVQAKRDTLPAVLDLLKQALCEPLLAEDKFDELRRQQLADLEQSRTEPGVQAYRLLSRLLAPYSSDDVRYAPTTDESIERMKNVKHSQVEQLYHDYLGSQAGELSIVGDFDPDACLPILHDALAGWKAKQPYRRIAMTVPKGLAGSSHTLETPDKANAVYASGMLFPMRDEDPDYPTLVMADYVFGSSPL